MKVKINSDDELPLNKTVEISTMAVAAQAIFHENIKYPEIFLDGYLHQLQII